MSINLLSAASALGWCGAITTAAAYAYVSQRHLRADSAGFAAVNVVGACLLTVSAAAHSSWPSAASNLVWVLIGVAALTRRHRTAHSKSTRTRGGGHTQVPQSQVARSNGCETDLHEEPQAA